MTGPLPAAEKLQLLIDHFRRIGQEVLWADATTSDVRDIGLHVARVILPGFHPLDFGFHERRLGGRRLFEAAARAEPDARPRELNPLPHPLA